MALTIGQFLGLRKGNQDTFADPYNVEKESFLELALPEEPFSPSVPAGLPPPPGVALSSPAGLPPPPNVGLSSPSGLPPEPAPPHGTPAILPPPPGVVLSSPAALPPEPAPPAGHPSTLPAPPGVTLSSPAILPAEPAPPPSVPAVLPAAPPVILSSPKALLPEPAPGKSIPANLPAPPPTIPSIPRALPPPPDVVNAATKDPAEVMPVANPRTPYLILGDRYSPVIGPADPGSLASDPFLYERSVERTAKLPPGKLLLHSLVQVGMFAQNVYGNVWNPALLDPPPILQNFIRPALDLPPEGTEKQQIQIGSLVNQAMDGAVVVVPPNNPLSRLTDSVHKQGVQVTLSRLKRNLADSFNVAKTGILANAAQAAAGGQADDPLIATAFSNGIIPMRLKGDNKFGFRTFKNGQTNEPSDDDVYLPLSFTDLRPVGADLYRAVYFRPLDLKVAESFSPEWNKQSYYGRVDPVVTYSSTGRSFSISFKLVAFGPEDVRTIYQKLHWLASMVYPEYDNNLVYKSGPVVRMRVGDVVNGFGADGTKGLAGIIESLEFDYNDSLWELKKDFKLPRNVTVSLTFTVLHDVPIGRGAQGQFGGLGLINEKGLYEAATNIPIGGGENDGEISVSPGNFRDFSGQGAQDLIYTDFKSIDP